MKIIIFIVVICTLFVVWSLCVVGASADEQLKRICDKEIRQMNYKVEKKNCLQGNRRRIKSW